MDLSLNSLSAVSRQLFRVYADETGDRGWGGSSSPVFVMSAVIVRDGAEKALVKVLDRINAAMKKPEGTVLHWAENVKMHSQRKYVAGELAALDMEVASVVVLKRSLVGTNTALSTPTEMYNYAIRLRVRPLQIADLVAGAFCSALRVDDFGNHEPSCLLTLTPRIYIRGRGQVTSYGFNPIGPVDDLATYPWWSSFLAACAVRRR